MKQTSIHSVSFWIKCTVLILFICLLTFFNCSSFVMHIVFHLFQQKKWFTFYILSELYLRYKTLHHLLMRCKIQCEYFWCDLNTAWESRGMPVIMWNHLFKPYSDMLSAFQLHQVSGPLILNLELLGPWYILKFQV